VIFGGKQRRKHFGRALLRKPALPDGHLVEHRAEAEDVGPRIQRQSTGLLRRHVPRRAHDDPGPARRRRHRITRPGRNPGQAKVDHLHEAIGPEHDVLGLDIAMHDARPVGCTECCCTLDGDGDRVRLVQSSLAQPVAKRDPFDELGRDEVRPVHFADFVDGDDVGMIECRRRLCFADEAPYEGGIPRVMRMQQLECGKTSESRITRDVDLTNRAGAYRREPLIGAQRSAVERVRGRADGVEMCLELSAIEEASRVVVGADERLHFQAQLRVICARVVKERRALVG
jgi:hypothetical protein